MKKILFTLLTLSLLVCAFMLCASAAEPSYKDGEWIYAADGVTKLAIRDTDGNPLIWYMNGEELKYVRADQTDATQPVYVKYSISAGGSGFNASVFSPEKTLKDIDIYDNGVQIECSGINSALVLFNMEKLDVDALNGWLWGNKNGCCTKMRGIFLPSTLKGIGQEGFTNTKLVQIWNLENTQLFYINNSNFATTSTLTQEATNGVFKCPQTVDAAPITVQNSQIKTYYMSPVSTFNTCQKWYQTWRNCKQLEKIIVPAHFAIGFGEEAFRDTPNQYLVFFTGTEADAINMRDNTQNYCNGGFKASQVISYDTYLLDKETYDNATKQAYIVYGYNYCEAFFDGAHENATTYGFNGEDKYNAEFCKFDGCVNCDNKQTVSYGKLFMNKGYSIEDTGDGFSFGISFNKEAIALYEEKMGATFTYGFVAGKITEGDAGAIVNQNGEGATDSVFTSIFTETSYELFTVKVTGITTDEFKAKDIYCNAFVIDGEDVYYVGQAVTSAAVSVSYDKIFASAGEDSTEE